MVFDGDERDVDTIIEQNHLRLVPLSRLQYVQMAEQLIGENEAMVMQIRKGQVGKVQWFVGQMMRKGEGMVEAEKAESVLRELLGCWSQGMMHGAVVIRSRRYLFFKSVEVAER